MAKRKVDLDKGVIVKKSRATGMLIYMYLDRPGVYLNAYEKPVSEDLAKQAGFDTVRLGKEKLKRERMKEAMAAIERELELADTSEDEVVLAERGDYRVVQLALGRANVVDNENGVVNPAPLPEEEAMLLLDHLAPPVDAPEETETEEVEENGSETA